MIKAIFLDIDGTLISIKTHRIPGSALRAVRKAREAGVLVFLCTSRARQFLTNIRGVEYDGIVCLTGASCIDGDGKVIASEKMDPGDVMALVEYAAQNDQALIGYADDAIYFLKEDSADVAHALELGGLKTSEIPGPHIGFTGGEEAWKTGISQFTAFFRPGDEERHVMGLMPHSHSERWIDDFVDVVPNGVDKGHGIDIMAGHYGFTPEEAMAAGDGANDIPMIRHAGIGVAMGNASDRVKAAADFVTADVDSDGLSLAIEKFVLCNRE